MFRRCFLKFGNFSNKLEKRITSRWLKRTDAARRPRATRQSAFAKSGNSRRWRKERLEIVPKLIFGIKKSRFYDSCICGRKLNDLCYYASLLVKIEFFCGKNR